MTKKEIAAKLREALALMNDSGAHWVQGEYSETLEWDDDDNPVEVGFCSLGAIRHVTSTPVEDPTKESNEVAIALAEVLPLLPDGPFPATPQARAWDRIVSWNDADERKWEEVVAKFNEAAERQEQTS